MALLADRRTTRSLGPGAVLTRGAAPFHVPHHKLTFAPGEALYLSGDRAVALFRVTDGIGRIVRLTPDGGVVTIRHVLQGDVFGEEAIVGGRRHAMAEAMTALSVDAIDPAFLHGGDLQVVAESFVLQVQRLMDFGYHLQSGDLRQRVARYLVWLADTPLASRGADGRTSVGVTHEIIAEGTGSTRESVSKIVAELRTAGLIASGYRAIELVDFEGLQMLAEPV